jgi:3-phenylpropionate/trans-cinnamate dioxygenase ferredoxin subunit
MVDEKQFQFIEIAPVSDLPVNERLFLEVGELPVVVYNLNGEFYATGDVCSHDHGPIGEGKIESYEVICPRHGARFDIRSGKVTRFPAARDIPSYPVKIENGKIFLGIPKE